MRTVSSYSRAIGNRSEIWGRVWFYGRRYRPAKKTNVNHLCLFSLQMLLEISPASFPDAFVRSVELTLIQVPCYFSILFHHRLARALFPHLETDATRAVSDYFHIVLLERLYLARSSCLIPSMVVFISRSIICRRTLPPTLVVL